MKNQINVFTNVKESSYFGGGFRGYALNQWDIKYYGWESEAEIALAQLVFFGENFESLKEAVGFDAQFFIEGRSGGWLCTDSELSVKQLQKITDYLKKAKKELPKFLKNERFLQNAYLKEQIDSLEAEVKELYELMHHGDSRSKVYFEIVYLQKVKELNQLKGSN